MDRAEVSDQVVSPLIRPKIRSYSRLKKAEKIWAEVFFKRHKKAKKKRSQDQ